MAVISEKITIKGKPFIHTYSDKGLKLERDGELYDDAYDLEAFGRKYNETNIPIKEVTAYEN